MRWGLIVVMLLFQLAAPLTASIVQAEGLHGREQSQHYDGISGTQSNSAEPTTVASPRVNWVHHTDGYHYKRLDDGTFDPVAHVKNDDGTYQPYS